MDDQKSRDSIISVIRQSFFQILEDPNLKGLKENEYSCNCILQRMTELFFDIFQSERQTQSQQLKAQYTMLKEYCQNLSHEKFEMQRELQNEMLKMSEETDKVSSNYAMINEELNMMKLKNEQLQIENKRIVSEQEILLSQINEQRATFQQNLEEMEMISNELKIELELSREKIKKLENTNDKQLQQIREYSLSIQKQQNKIKETENQYLIESSTKSRHLNELEHAQKNLRELELLLRQQNEDNAKQSEEIRLHQNQVQDLEKQVKALESQANEKKREIHILQKQHEQVLIINEENQKKFILNTVNKYKDKIQAYKKKLQEYKDKQDEQSKLIYQLQLQDNEEKNGYQKQIQHIESQIQQVQTQYEGIIANIKQNSKSEQENLKEGYEKDLQLKELQHKQELVQLEMQMKERIKNIEERSISKEFFEVSKKDKQDEMERIEREKATMINELNNTIKQQNVQIEKQKEQINVLNYHVSQNEISQNKYRIYEEEIQKLTLELGKKQGMLIEQKDKIKQSQLEIENKDRENVQLQEDIKNLDEQNYELQLKLKDIEKRLNQQIKQIKEKSESQAQENYKLSTELRDIRKEQEFEKKQNKEMLILLEKRQQGVSIELNEVQTLRSSNAVLQGKLENINARLNDTKESFEQAKKEKEYLATLVEQQNKKIRVADELKIKFSIKIKQIMKNIQQIKEETNGNLQKELVERLSQIRKEYYSQIEDFTNKFIQIHNKYKDDEIQLTHNLNILKQQFEELKLKHSKYLSRNDILEENDSDSPKRIDLQKQRSRSGQKQKRKIQYGNSKDENEDSPSEDASSNQGNNRKRRNQRYDDREDQISEDEDDNSNNNRQGRSKECYNTRNHLRKSYSDSKGRFHNQQQENDQECYDIEQRGNKNKNSSHKRNKSEIGEDKRKSQIEDQLRKQIEIKSEKLLLEEYVMDDLRRIKQENAEMVEERMRLVARVDSLSNELGQKQIQAETLSAQINLLLREAGLNQSENSQLRKRVSEAEMQLRKIDDIERINQELINQDAQVRQECKQQNKQLIESLQREVAEYRQKELENLQKIAKQEIELEEKVSQLSKIQAISIQEKANYEFKTRILSEQKEQAAQLHSQDQQMTEYRDEIQTLLQENSQLLRQVQLLQADIEGLHLALEKARIQIQIADQRENQLTNQNQQLQQEILSSHLDVQKISNELSSLQLSITNDKLRMKQKLNIKKEKQIMKDKMESQNIKEIQQMIENSYLSLKKKNSHTYKSSIQLTSNFAPTNSSANNSLSVHQLQQQNSNNLNFQFDQTNSNSQSLKLLNAGISSSPIQNTFSNSFMKSSNLGQLIPQHNSSQQHLQNITNSLHNRSQKNLSLHTSNTMYQTPNHHTASYNNFLINHNNSKDTSQAFSNSIQKSSNINSPQYLISNNFVRSGFVKFNNNMNNNEPDYNSQMNTSNNQSHNRGQSLTQPHQNHQSSTSSLLNNQYKYMSSNSTNIPANHTFCTSIHQNDYNQSTNKLLQSNSKSQSNLFASQNSVTNNNPNYNNNVNNNNFNYNNSNVQNNLLHKNKNDSNHSKLNQEESKRYKTNYEDKNRGKSVSTNATGMFSSNGLGDTMKNKNMSSPQQIDQFTQNLNISREVDNPHLLKEDTFGKQLEMKQYREQDGDTSKVRSQRNSKYESLIPPNNIPNAPLKIEKIQSENESIIQKLNKLQQLDQYLQRSRSQSSNFNGGSLSVKSAINQASIPSFQQNIFQPSGASTPVIASNLGNSINSYNEERRYSKNEGNSSINNDLYNSTNRASQLDEIVQKQKLFSHRTTDTFNVTPPSQSHLKSQQTNMKPSNSQKESQMNKDDASTFTPFSNNNLQEAISFADHDLVDILGNKHNHGSEYISSQSQSNKYFNYAQEKADLDNKLQNQQQQLYNTRRSQSFHNNYPKKI